MNEKLSVNPQITITIILYNSAKTIEKCLDCLSEYPSDKVEIIVIDNLSPDNSSEIVAQKFPNVKIIKSDKNLGFAGGHNLAWDLIHGKYWLILNPDAFVEKNGLNELVEIMENDEKIGILSPMLVDSNKNESSISMSFPSISVSLLQMTRILKFFPQNLRGKMLKVPSMMQDKLIELDWVPGTAILVRKSIISEVGLLSDDFFMYAEDVEFCWRVKSKGWKVVMTKNVTVEHIGGTSSVNKSRETLIDKTIPNYYLADSRIAGTKKALILHLIRTISYGIESLNIKQPNKHRKDSFAIFKSSLKFLFKNILSIDNYRML